jgi:hypothetical protein
MPMASNYSSAGMPPCRLSNVLSCRAGGEWGVGVLACVPATSMSSAIVRVCMRTNHPGVMGRYQVKCGQGLCALTGEQATSKLEGALFALLHM